MSLPRVRSYLLLFAAIALCGHTGCIARFAALVRHATVGNTVPAKYQNFEDRDVAVICLSRSRSFGSTTAAEDINRRVVKYMRKHVKGLQLVPAQEIETWIDEHDWNEIDYRELGYGVGADVLIAVDMDRFTLYEGKNLFKGRADVEITIYDMTLDGEVVLEETPPEIVYPVTAGVFTAEMTETEFKKQFIDFVAYRIARNFYPYELSDDFGRDPSSVGF
ncbi:MAG: hypothetical protein AAGF97_02715 [Planctomycetota bacterium]